jgi:hypothetical protein
MPLSTIFQIYIINRDRNVHEKIINSFFFNKKFKFSANKFKINNKLVIQAEIVAFNFVKTLQFTTTRKLTITESAFINKHIFLE